MDEPRQMSEGIRNDPLDWGRPGAFPFSQPISVVPPVVLT